jgi:hypothetical protein
LATYTRAKDLLEPNGREDYRGLWGSGWGMREGTYGVKEVVEHARVICCKLLEVAEVMNGKSQLE